MDAFSYDDEVEQPKKVTLNKVSSKKSMVDSLNKKPSKESLEQQVKEVKQVESGYKRRISDLSKKFLHICSDKTLVKNKDPFSVSFENEVLVEINKLASDINRDESQEEGMGSIVVSSMLLKVILFQRDRLNELEYALMQFRQDFSKLNKIVGDLENSVKNKNIDGTK